MTTDTDALLATVREAISGDGPISRYYKQQINWQEFHEGQEAARAALDSLAVELERETQEHRACGESLIEATAKWEAAEAELERVKAERDEAQARLAIHRDARGDDFAALVARLDKALSAMRYALPALQEYSIGADNQGYQSAASALHEAHEVLARCIAEIEGEA